MIVPTDDGTDSIGMHEPLLERGPRRYEGRSSQLWHGRG